MKKTEYWLTAAVCIPVRILCIALAYAVFLLTTIVAVVISPVMHGVKALGVKVDWNGIGISMENYRHLGKFTINMATAPIGQL